MQVSFKKNEVYVVFLSVSLDPMCIWNFSRGQFFTLNMLLHSVIVAVLLQYCSDRALNMCGKQKYKTLMKSDAVQPSMVVRRQDI